MTSRAWIVLASVSLVACSDGPPTEPTRGTRSGVATGSSSGSCGSSGGDAAVDAPEESVVSGDAASDAGGFWSPPSNVPVHFHWQLSTTLSVPGDVLPGETVFDIDGETNPASTVQALHALGPQMKAVCYVDVGTYEDFRSDAASFPAAVLGTSNGWPGERWLDVRQKSVLLPIMQARIQRWCVAKGFDAMEPDNLDGWLTAPASPSPSRTGCRTCWPSRASRTRWASRSA